MAAKQFVKTVKVTNDVAARGVKIASDYAIISTRDSKIRQMFFQVEKDRIEKVIKQINCDIILTKYS